MATNTNVSIKDDTQVQVIFTPDMLESVGAARQYIATELHNKRNLEQAAVFLQVYNDAVLSLDSLQQQVAMLQQQVASTQVQLDGLQQVYTQEQGKYAALTKEVQQQYSNAVVDLTQKMQDAVAVHNIEMALLDTKRQEAAVATQEIIDGLHSAVTTKRQELAEVTEQYDKVSALLHGFAKQITVQT